MVDVCDGLDDVRRRCLSLLGDRYVRSAKVARDPASYDALTALAQEFRQRYPLVDGRGNFGSVDGDPPADAEYTEVRLAPLAHELPRFPNLLVNGSSAIPPHNLREVVAAVIAFLEEPAIDVPGLMEHLPGPDFPSGGVLADRASLRGIYETGSGSLRVRARALVEEDTIVITELPFGVEKGGEEGVIFEIMRLHLDGKLPALSDMKDHSDRRGQRLLISVTAADPRAALEEFYKHSSLETTFAVDMVALVDGVPERLSLPALIGLFVGGRDPSSIRSDLQDIASRFGDDRRTSLGA
jgi:DNA gyrase subunit A